MIEGIIISALLISKPSRSFSLLKIQAQDQVGDIRAESYITHPAKLAQLKIIDCFDKG